MNLARLLPIATLLFSTHAMAQTDTLLASWTYHGKFSTQNYTATLKGGSLIVRTEDSATSGWQEHGAAMSDIVCGYVIQRPIGEPATEVLLNFLTAGESIFAKGPNRVWGRNSSYPTPVYDNTDLGMYFDLADQNTALAIGNKVIDASGGHVHQCKE